MLGLFSCKYEVKAKFLKVLFPSKQLVYFIFNFLYKNKEYKYLKDLICKNKRLQGHIKAVHSIVSQLSNIYLLHYVCIIQSTIHKFMLSILHLVV